MRNCRDSLALLTAPSHTVTGQRAPDQPDSNSQIVVSMDKSNGFTCSQCHTDFQGATVVGAALRGRNPGFRWSELETSIRLELTDTVEDTPRQAQTARAVLDLEEPRRTNQNRIWKHANIRLKSRRKCCLRCRRRKLMRRSRCSSCAKRWHATTSQHNTHTTGREALDTSERSSRGSLAAAEVPRHNRQAPLRGRGRDAWKQRRGADGHRARRTSEST